MQKFIVSTDSGCDLPLSLCEGRGIIPFKLHYFIEGQSFEDTMCHEDLKKFYDDMRKGAVPKTSQINVYEFVNFFKTLLPQNLPIVYISLGSGISGTYANALLAKDVILRDFPGTKIYVVDSTLASVGYGMLALKAAQMRDEGCEPEACVQWLDAHKAEINTYYTTDDLTYLCRGGRVSKTSAIIGNMLNINPILKLDKEGHLLVTEKIRGTKATIKRIQAIVRDLAIDPQEQTLYICHSDIPEKAKKFGDEICEMMGFKDVYYTYIGSIIGSHSGPGLMAAFFYGKPRTMSLTY